MKGMGWISFNILVYDQGMKRKLERRGVVGCMWIQGWQILLDLRVQGNGKCDEFGWEQSANGSGPEDRLQLCWFGQMKVICMQEGELLGMLMI